mgnify:FL=1
MISMKHAFLSCQSGFSHDGSGVNQQAVVYGHLNDQPLQLRHQIGFSWSIHGWLLSDVLPTLPFDRIDAMKRQIQQEVLTTFSTNYHQAISLRDTLDPNCIREYAKMRTGEKFVVVS